MSHSRHAQFINPPLLRHAGRKYVHLTSKERAERRRIALHEAAHFTTGWVLKAHYSCAFVRVPGRTPNDSDVGPSMAGYACVNGVTPRDNVMIWLAPVFVEFAINPEIWRRRAGHDRDRAEEILTQAGITKRDEIRALCDRTLRIVVDHWPAIDGVAAGFLELGDESGFVSAGACGLLSVWIHSGKWKQRAPAYRVPTQFRNRLASIDRTARAFAPSVAQCENR